MTNAELQFVLREVEIAKKFAREAARLAPMLRAANDFAAQEIAKARALLPRPAPVIEYPPSWASSPTLSWASWHGGSCCVILPRTNPGDQQRGPANTTTPANRFLAVTSRG